MKNRKVSTFLVGAVAIFSLLAAACGQKEDSGGGATDAQANTEVSGRVVITGSSTVEPISSLVAEEFQAQNSNVRPSVDGPGTGDGFKEFCAGDADISDASRPIKEEEASVCEENEIEYIELKIALDGIVVIANNANELECLNFADLYALIGPESRGFGNWQDAQDLAADLGSDTEFPNAPLDITAPGEESGTYDSFIEIALQKTGEARYEAGELEDEDQAETTRPDYQASANDNAIIQGVEGSNGGLGWVGFAYAEQQGDALRKMPIAEEPGGDCVEPTQETIRDGSYPISRALYIYVNAEKAESDEALAAFVDFYLEGLEGFVEGADYTNLDDEELAATRQVWEDRETGTREG